MSIFADRFSITVWGNKHGQMLRESLRGKRTEKQKRDGLRERKLDIMDEWACFFSQQRNETEMSLYDELAICKDGRPHSSEIN